ncbi:MAG: biotin/lipoyl-containing protein [Candidatus Nanopelagicaceae bacterium]|nr:biotin/lipoyl-containing protein [Candidatus Nanopelagicaceae bacterium]
MSKFEYAVIMPKMSMTMEEGELLGIRVNVGDAVKSGDILFDVATDKIDMEVESPADGVVKEIVGQVGSTMLVGAPVLILLTDTQVMSFNFNTPAAPEVTAEEVTMPVVVIVPELEVIPVAEKTVMAMPKARVVAESRGIDIKSISPTGPFGTVTYEDVNKLSGSTPQTASVVDMRKAANRKKVAEALELTRGIPQITLSRFSSHTTSSLEQGSAHLVSTWARIIRNNAHVNVSTHDESTHEFIGVGLIMESKYGLAIPVFRDPDLSPGITLQEWIQNTRVQALAGKVPVQMLSGATTSIFDISHTKIASAIPMLLPTHTTALSVGAPHSSFGESEINLTVDLRYCDALEAASLLDQLIDAL